MLDHNIKETRTYSIISRLGNDDALKDLKGCTSDEGFISIDVDELMSFEKEIENSDKSIDVHTLKSPDLDATTLNIRNLLAEYEKNDTFLIISGPSLEISFGNMMKDVNMEDYSSNVIFGVISRPDQKEYIVTGIGVKE